MVQLLLRWNSNPCRLIVLATAWALLLLVAPLPATSRSKNKPATQGSAPQLLLEGGRKLSFERSISDERDVRGKRGFWKRLVDLVAGEPAFRNLVRPYGVVTDSRGRVIITDPGAKGIHIFDFAGQKYKFVSRPEGKEAMGAPQCVTVDSRDNIYVTDSEAGKVFVFDKDGKFQHAIGSRRRIFQAGHWSCGRF
jgi:hypothetical protein